MKSCNGVIGVGRWVEMNSGCWLRIDPRDPKSWFMFPWITLMEAMGR